jgi:transposase-like protein
MTRNESRAHWQRRLAEQQASGLSVSAWCAQQGIRRKQYYYWRQQCHQPAQHDPTPQWLPVAITEPAPAVSALTLQVGAVRIEVMPGFDPAVLAAVVRVLEGARW